MNMANSIANLRLKAKEYSLNQVPTVNWGPAESGFKPTLVRTESGPDLDWTLDSSFLSSKPKELLNQWPSVETI